MARKRPLCNKTDSYKASHFLQWMETVRRSFYYLAPRLVDAEVMTLGYRYVIKEHLMEVPTAKEVYAAAKFWKAHGEPFNLKGWLKIVELGYLPVEIKAVPEGMSIPSNKVMVTMESTMDGFAWLPGWIETLMLQMWYPSTVATRSKEMRKIIYKYLVLSGDTAGLGFKLHDFGYRGVTCQEQAEIGGMAHLATGAMGTDTACAILLAQEIYGSDEMFAFSIPAAEHSTIGNWLRDGETKAFKNMIKQFGEGAMFAVVSDTYDLEDAVKNKWCGELKADVEAMNATLIVRPDSGDPCDEVVKVAQWLEAGFGTTMNEKGYKVLNNVAIIHGDSINGASDVEAVYKALTDAGFSADNLALGAGGGLLQKMNRDTKKWAAKCSAALIGDKWEDVYKCPVDAPWKASKKGRLTLTRDFEEVLVEDCAPEDELLVVVFRNGVEYNELTFPQVRANAWNEKDEV